MTCRQSIGENLRQVRELNSSVSCIFFTLHSQENAGEPMNILRQTKIAVTTVYCGEVHDSAKSGSSGGRFVPLDHLLPEVYPL
jgi:hypothetical protein